jgi:hypothetical protein
MANVVQFNYDGQIRRFVLQFIRMLSNFQVQFGKDSAGNTTLQTVPIYYGDQSRQAATILKNNSENMLNAVPAMSAYISGLTYDRDRLQNPYFESTKYIREQRFNATTQEFTGVQDNLYAVDRLMPAPYKLTMKLDIWTSNTEQKHQLLEQILPLVNPGFEIQSTDNYLDWTSLSIALLTDVAYSNRSVPAGADESIDITSLTFELPIWITFPAKVKKGGVVAQIVANIYDASGELNTDTLDMVQTAQVRYTPFDYDITYLGNTLTLYKSLSETGQGTTMSWPNLINLYGTLVNGISQVRLKFEFQDGEHELIGHVAYDPSNVSQLIFSPIEATLPANTLDAVDAIIDPFAVDVDNSGILTPTTGTRYLILNPIGGADSTGAIAWAGAAGTNLVAKANDIIEWNGSYWTVSFDSTEPTVQYVTNLTTTTQYCWSNGAWVKSVEGIYRKGKWSLVL